MLPSEVFLSHSSADTDTAGRLAAVIARHGIPVFFSPRNILGAQQWHDEIGAALSRCDWLVVLLSPGAVESIWVKRELLYALQHDRYEGRIIPIIYRECEYDHLSWTLSQYQMIDFTAGFVDGCRELLRIWGVGLNETLLP